jgi:hypothetical protein
MPTPKTMAAREISEIGVGNMDASLDDADRGSSLFSVS